jgi:nucleoside-diphosphate-sugar epimerase
MNQQLHVVFGTGPAGLALVDELLAKGHQVRAVNRGGKAPVPEGVEMVAADVTDRDVMHSLSAGATTIYNCTHAPYHLWGELLPQLHNAFLDAATVSGARLVVTDTLYMYGPTHGAVMTEQTPHNATSDKGRMRAEIAARYLDAYAAGTAKVALARAADFYGPRVTMSALGAAVFFPALQGKPVIAMGDIRLPHSYTYIADVAKALATLGEHDSAMGKAWHVPTAPALPTEEIHRLIGKELGHELTADILTEATDEAWGPFDATFMREYVELFYQYTEPQIVDSTAIANAFGLRPTPITDGLRETIAWYRAQLGSTA